MPLIFPVNPVKTDWKFMAALENYLRDLRDIHATIENVKETSFYPPLANLFNAIDVTLKSKVWVALISRIAEETKWCDELRQSFCWNCNSIAIMKR